MPDEPTTSDAQPPSTEEGKTLFSQPTPDPASFINPDGTLKEGWKDHLIPEEYRGLGEFEKVKSVQDINRQLGYSVKLQGKKGVIIPGPGSSETEIAEYRKAIGVPESSENYQYQPAENLELVDMSAEAMKPALEKMHQAGYTQEHVNTALGIFTDFMTELEGEVDTAMNEALEEAETKIAEFTGQNYEQRLKLANIAIDKITEDWDETRRNELFDPETGLVNDPAHAELKPYLLDLFAHAGEKMVEKKLLLSEEAVPGGMTRSQCEAKIAEIEAIPGFILRDSNGKLMQEDGRLDQYRVLAKERDRLYRMMSNQTS